MDWARRLPQDLLCIFPKSQSWGEQERRNGGSRGQRVWSWGGAERTSCLQPWICCSWSQRSQSHVQPCPDVPGACRDVQMGLGDWAWSRSPVGGAALPALALVTSKEICRSSWKSSFGHPSARGCGAPRPWGCAGTPRQGCEGNDALGTAGRNRGAQPPWLPDLTLDARSVQGHRECPGAQGVSLSTRRAAELPGPGRSCSFGRSGSPQCQHSHCRVRALQLPGLVPAWLRLFTLQME